MGKLTKAKAKKILHEGIAHGRKLTKKQYGFFGARASGKAYRAVRRQGKK